MECLTPQQANMLLKIRDYYRLSDMESECEQEIGQLLNIIDSLESFHTLANKTKIELHGWNVTLRGRYKESTNKLCTALQFVVMSKSFDDTEVLDIIKKRYSGRNNLLDGFEILDYELHAINEKTMCVGTGVSA